ncbi:jg2229 [Pararge aegeria aegeria]|uniref:Jg2229 protein n=1 Tax=Pararge aegeria aegeria TaxID=348720 RepID=A0A8S4SJB8_9NEOP|nr:jg2229 [Pararge aegeria aegeria]
MQRMDFTGGNRQHCTETRCGNGKTAPVNIALVDLQRGGQTTSSESLGAAKNKRPRNVDFETLCKRLVQQ